MVSVRLPALPFLVRGQCQAALQKEPLIETSISVSKQTKTYRSERLGDQHMRALCPKSSSSESACEVWESLWASVLLTRPSLLRASHFLLGCLKVYNQLTVPFLRVCCMWGAKCYETSYTLARVINRVGVNATCHPSGANAQGFRGGIHVFHGLLSSCLLLQMDPLCPLPQLSVKPPTMTPMSAGSFLPLPSGQLWLKP